MLKSCHTTEMFASKFGLWKKWWAHFLRWKVFFFRVSLKMLERKPTRQERLIQLKWNEEKLLIRLRGKVMYTHIARNIQMIIIIFNLLYIISSFYSDFNILFAKDRIQNSWLKGTYKKYFMYIETFLDGEVKGTFISNCHLLLLLLHCLNYVIKCVYVMSFQFLRLVGLIFKLTSSWH